MSIEMKRDSETRHLLWSIYTMDRLWLWHGWMHGGARGSMMSLFLRFCFLLLSSPPVIKEHNSKGATRSSSDFNVRANRKRCCCFVFLAYLRWLLLRNGLGAGRLVFFQYCFVVGSSSFCSFRACRERGEGVGSGSMIHSAFLFCSVFDRIRSDSKMVQHLAGPGKRMV